MPYRLATDIGGTFTDAVLLDEATGRIKFTKVPTTPKDFAIGTMNSIDKFGIPLEEVSFLSHGTTVVINALIQGTGAKVGLITTEGFRDIFEMGRGNKPQMYDPLYRKPRPLIKRSLRLEVNGRINYRGEILKPLNEEQARKAARKLRGLGVESIAVCLLNSYANPIHEDKVEAIVKQEYPEAHISPSHDLTREYREYERTGTTVLNAYVMPITERYLASIEFGLRERGFRTDLMVMQSSGGIMTSEVAKLQPINIVESGPVAGVIGAMSLGEALGYENVISFDMGGTTAKSSVIYHGTPRITREYTIRGHPIMLPIIDIEEIGAGGGSITWIDAAGALHVGPQSAGAEPGPACYDLGGIEPTVTDANLLVKRLNPDYFLGGEMKVYPNLARDAVQKIASYYKMDLTQAAYGIIEIVNAGMSGLLRALTIRRGYDPRDFVIIAFGGGGPMHIMALAEELEIPEVIVPPVPGNFSAWGMLMTDLKYDFIRTFVNLMDKTDMGQLNNMYESLEHKGIDVLKRQKVSEEDIRLTRYIDVRYFGQEHAIMIPLPAEILTEDHKSMICNKFDEMHELTYRHCAPEEPKEIVSLRVTALGIVKKPELRKIKSGSERPPADAFKGKRSVYFKEMEGYVSCPIYERRKLLASNILDGPAIIEEPTSTGVIHPDQRVRVDPYGSLIISTRGGEV